MNEKGWDSVFIPWQRKLMEAVYKYPEGMNTRKGWEHLEGNISRASVINTLVRWEKDGMLKSVERSGKGGFRAVYSPIYPDIKDLETFLKLKFSNYMKEELQGSIVE